MALYEAVLLLIQLFAIIGFGYVMYRIWVGGPAEKRRAELRNRLRDVHGELQVTDLERMVREEEAKLNAKRNARRR